MNQRRDNPPEGHIHIPSVGPVRPDTIHSFRSDRQYCWVQMHGEDKPRLLSEPLAYFQRRLPHFQRTSRYTLVNPVG